MGEARSIGVGMDYSASSKSAVKWALDSLLDKGDRIILIHVQSPKSPDPQKNLFANTGSPLIPLDEFKDVNISKLYGISPDVQFLEALETDCMTKGVKVECKIYWGDAGEKICNAVQDLKLDSIVVGSRGLGTLKRVLLGSVSNYVVMNAACPVTVVKEKCSK